MLNSSARVRPCIARSRGASLGRVTSRLPSSSVRLTSGTTSRVSVPLGAVTLLLRPSISILTALGTGIGCLPIRDIQSPHVAQNFAANSLLTRHMARHHTLRRRENGDTQAAEHARYLALLYIYTQAGLAHPLDPAEYGFLAARVAQLDLQHGARALRAGLEIADEALVLEDPCDRELDF